VPEPSDVMPVSIIALDGPGAKFGKGIIGKGRVVHDLGYKCLVGH